MNVGSGSGGDILFDNYSMLQCFNCTISVADFSANKNRNR